jgi:hypothetical protein
MRQKRIALLACSNGMGHVRRLLSLSLELRARGAHPVLFAEESKLRCLCNAYQIDMPEFIEFSSQTERINWTTENKSSWISNLPGLDGFDSVVSDNLIEVLALRPDAWLSGSFFWHRALNSFPAERAAYAELLLREHRPRMISSGLFTAPYLHSSTRLSLVGLYAFPEIGKQTKKTDILISCGTGGGATEETAAMITCLASMGKPPCRTLWIEPSLYKISMPYWIQPATFSPSMYFRLACAIIRPGVGTATDVLLAGARVYSFYEAGNDEMYTNAASMEVAGVGEDCKTASLAWASAVSYMGNSYAKESHHAAVVKLDRDGASKAATLINESR